MSKSFDRLIARQVSELLIWRGGRWQQALGVNRYDNTVLGVVLSANLAHLPLLEKAPPRWIGLTAVGERGRAVRLHGVARSMGLVDQSVRRRANTLVERGLLLADGLDYRVPADLPLTAACRALWAADAAALIELVEFLADQGHAPALALAAADHAAVPRDVLARALLDYAVRLMEDFTALFGDILEGSIFVAVTAANVRPTMADPDVSQRYAELETLPPDSARVPVTASRLAEELELPRETVRRRIRSLIVRGLIEPVLGGVIVPTRVMASPEQVAYTHRVASQFTRMLGSIRQAAAQAD